MRVLLLAALALVTTTASLGAQERTRTIAAAPDARVRIENPTGPTTVVGWDRNEVRIETASGDPRDVTIRTDGRRIDVTAVPNVAITVRVPKGVMLDVRSGSGPIHITAVENTIECESGSGPINIDAVARSITAIGFSGGVSIRGGGTQITRAESASGSVNVSQARGVVDLTSISGSVSAVGQIRDGKLFTVSGSATFNGTVERGGRLTLESTSGSVALRIPSSTPAEYELNTVHGHIQNGFGPRPQASGHSVGANLRFAVGGGGARIKASTVSGSVILSER